MDHVTTSVSICLCPLHFVNGHYVVLIVYVCMPMQVSGKIPIPPRFAFGIYYSRYWAYSDFGDMVIYCVFVLKVVIVILILLGNC